MSFKLPPYLQWRDGRPRWIPGPKLRPAWKGQDLKDEAGHWLGLEAAIARAREINARVKEGSPPVPRARINRRPVRTVAALAEHWRTSPEFGLLAPATQRDYLLKAEVFAAEFGSSPVAAVGRAALKGFWRELYETRGHHMANGVLAVARAMLTHATDLEWIAVNPGFSLKLKTPAPRQVAWLPGEVSALVAAADAMGLAEVGDAVIAALHTGQRQADVLALPLRIFETQRIRLSQAKMRGRARIDAPMTPALAARVAAIRARRAQRSNVVDLDAPLILHPSGARYASDCFRKHFAEVRARAVAGGEGARGCPDLAGRRFQDLRDTAVTRLALAGCDLPQIAAITGHELGSITSIIKHYLVLQPAMADAAIGKLSAWLEANRIEL